MTVIKCDLNLSLVSAHQGGIFLALWRKLRINKECWKLQLVFSNDHGETELWNNGAQGKNIIKQAKTWGSVRFQLLGVPEKKNNNKRYSLKLICLTVGHKKANFHSGTHKKIQTFSGRVLNTISTSEGWGMNHKLRKTFPSAGSKHRGQGWKLLRHEKKTPGVHFSF